MIGSWSRRTFGWLAGQGWTGWSTSAGRPGAGESGWPDTASPAEGAGGRERGVNAMKDDWEWLVSTPQGAAIRLLPHGGENALSMQVNGVSAQHAEGHVMRKDVGLTSGWAA